MIKKILMITAVIAALAVAAVFFYRYNIIAYSTEQIIRGAMPSYVKVAAIRFDFKEKKAYLDGFRIEGPRGFSDRYIVEIAEISCSYKMKGATILDGLEIFEPVLKDMVLRIERLYDGRINLSEMKNVMKIAAVSPSRGSEAWASGPEPVKDTGPKAADFIKLPEQFTIRNGRVVFTDRFFVRGYHVINLGNIEAALDLLMNDSYTRVLKVSSTGEGKVNGRPDQTIRWTTGFDPNAAKLTMSNRLEVSGVDLLTFEPYYDRFSPFEFARARVSGLLIFDFQNGNIGSSNELHFNDLVFSVKPGYENKFMFETNVKELVRYFTSSTGEVVFDFKIKGDMANPQFYLGPISKQAITAMVVDKVSDAIQQMSKKGQAPAGPSGNTDVDKAIKAIEMFKGFLDKKS